MNFYDFAYCLAGGVASPIWLIKAAARRKVFSALRDRMGHLAPRDRAKPAVLIHAVSLGEINATRELVQRLRAGAGRPLHFVISSTTETGMARGKELYGGDPDITVVRFPLDFSGAVRRFLDALEPSVVVLMELEIWPNFLVQCATRQLPVLLINGRVTTASFARYKLIRPLTRRMFRRVARICAQDPIYVQRFVELGADPKVVRVTGTMKFDTAQVAPPPGTAPLAAAVGLTPGSEPIWVCGSTGPGEEAIVLDHYKSLLTQFPNLRLVIVPRKPERFDEVAGIIAEAGFACLRRSKRETAGSARPVILGDTMGELRCWFAMADVVFVGRTLVDQGPRQHGSDMIEPAALAKAVIVGPFTGNFAQPMARFVYANAIRVIEKPPQLGPAVAALLSDRAQAESLGSRARKVVLDEQGATDRHVSAILDFLK